MNMAKYVVGRQCEQCMEQMVLKTDEFLEKFQGEGGGGTFILFYRAGV